MNITCVNNNGTKYLKLMRSTKSKTKNGEYKQKNTIVLNIGPLSKFDDGAEDYLFRLRQSFKEGKPIIKSLEPFVENERKEVSTKIKIEFDENYMIGDPKIVSDILLTELMSNLNLDSIFSIYKSRHALSFDVLGIFRLLVMGRIIKPRSKISTFKQKEQYFNQICKSENPFNVYDTLDIIYEKRKTIIQTIHNSISSTIGRNDELMFYDVTNFYFETEYADDNEEINGEEVKGLRQRGVSKEKRKSPIVQAGLFMDQNGLPVSIETFPGNTLDQSTLRPALQSTINNLNCSRFILVADRGITSAINSHSLLKNNHGYIMSKSIKKSNSKYKKWVLDGNDYIQLGNGFRYKSIIQEIQAKDEDGNTHKYKEKSVVYFSEKFYKKEYNEHKSFMEFIEKLKNSPSSFRVTSRQSGMLKKFIKKDFKNKKTGEEIKSSDLIAMLDYEKLNQYTELMGYYQIVTSEIDMNDLEVISKYKKLTQIEDQFRVLKSNLDIRPVYVRTREHIVAHITICFVALVLARLIQIKVKENESINEFEKNVLWTQGITVERIQESFLNWKVEELPGNYVRFYGVTEDLKRILSAYGLEIKPTFYSRKDLKDMKKAIHI